MLWLLWCCWTDLFIAEQTLAGTLASVESVYPSEISKNLDLCMIQSRAVLIVTCAGNTDIDKIMLHVCVRCFNKPLDSLVNVNDAAVSRKSRWHGQAGCWSQCWRSQ